MAATTTELVIELFRAPKQSPFKWYWAVKEVAINGDSAVHARGMAYTAPEGAQAAEAKLLQIEAI